MGHGKYGVSVYGVAWGHRREVETPSLMADMFGFMSKEEMSDIKEYLCSHGNYQLEQVGATEHVSVSIHSITWVDEYIVYACL